MLDFTLVGRRYIFCEGKHVCTILMDEVLYSNPLLHKLNEYKTAKLGLDILNKMINSGSLRNILRDPNKTDKVVVEGYLNPQGTNSKFGEKHMCAHCGKKFYDLCGRISSCPTCKYPATLG